MQFLDTVQSVLRDPALRSILAILALCVAAAGLVFGQWWWRRKALTYTFDKTVLLNVHEDVKPRVKILFDDAPVQDVCFLSMTLANAGHEPVKANEFERPIGFHCGTNAQILSANVIKTNPHLLNPVIKISGTKFELEPLLLNRGDFLHVTALVNQMGSFEVDARIAGVKEITLTTPGERLGRKHLGALASLVVLAVIAVTWAGTHVYELRRRVADAEARQKPPIPHQFQKELTASDCPRRPL